MSHSASGASSPHAFPDTYRERNRWVERLRPEVVRAVRPERAAGSFVEREPGKNVGFSDVFTLFLSNKECPWRCVMCDLWRHTLLENTPAGAIPHQIRTSLAELTESTRGNENLSRERHLKLYNSGSFFDARAIPPVDHEEIARLAAPFHKVIVECHPHLIDERCLRFRDLLLENVPAGSEPRLEIAIGLETANPEVLNKLNKGFGLPGFEKAARFLQKNEIGLRVFLLVQPPFLPVSEVRDWTLRSVNYARANTSAVISLIPTRGGNGAMEELQTQGLFTPPSLATLEECQQEALNAANGETIILADTWDLQPFATCEDCREERVARIGRINLSQSWCPAVACSQCGFKPG